VSRSVRAGLALALLALTAAGAGGQEVQGLAVGPMGEPLPGVVVALHRVGDGGAGTVASATTGDDGRFEFQLETRDSAYYFVAMRHEDRMYIGPLALAGAERVTGYIVSADPDSEAGAVAAALAPRGTAGSAGMGLPARAAPADGGGAPVGVWLAAVLALAAGATFVATAPRYRRLRTREALVELATLENRLAEGPESGEREDLAARRDRLRERLSPPA
jgi:hypothetical protein